MTNFSHNWIDSKVSTAHDDPEHHSPDEDASTEGRSMPSEEETPDSPSTPPVFEAEVIDAEVIDDVIGTVVNDVPETAADDKHAQPRIVVHNQPLDHRAPSAEEENTSFSASDGPVDSSSLSSVFSPTFSPSVSQSLSNWMQEEEPSSQAEAFSPKPEPSPETDDSKAADSNEVQETADTMTDDEPPWWAREDEGETSVSSDAENESAKETTPWWLEDEFASATDEPKSGSESKTERAQFDSSLNSYAVEDEGDEIEERDEIEEEEEDEIEERDEMEEEEDDQFEEEEEAEDDFEEEEESDHGNPFANGFPTAQTDDESESAWRWGARTRHLFEEEGSVSTSGAVEDEQHPVIEWKKWEAASDTDQSVSDDVEEEDSRYVMGPHIADDLHAAEVPHDAEDRNTAELRRPSDDRHPGDHTDDEEESTAELQTTIPPATLDTAQSPALESWAPFEPPPWWEESLDDEEGHLLPEEIRDLPGDTVEAPPEEEVEEEDEFALEDEFVPEEEIYSVGLRELVDEFTALRHELKLQTKSTRNLQEQSEDVVGSLQQRQQHLLSAIQEETGRSVRSLEQALEAFRQAPSREKKAAEEAIRPFIEFMADMDEALERGREAMAATGRHLANETEDQLHAKLKAVFEGLSWWQKKNAFPWKNGVLRVCREHFDYQREHFEALLEGYDLIRGRLHRTMHRNNLVRMECLGQRADPETMTVLDVVYDPSLPNGSVVEEVRPGYFWNEKVLRFAEVKANKHRP